MNIHNVKKPHRRFDIRYLSSMNIQAYGGDNLYPQRMQDLILNSSTGDTCRETYERFIKGGGLKDEDFGSFICNRQGDTVADILHLVAKDLSLFRGFALHVNYSLTGEVIEVQPLHFEACRLEEEDDLGRVCYIAWHPDWTGRKTRNGRRIEVTESNVRKFFVFNPNRDIVLDQIRECGGIDKYGGQVLWYSMDGRFVYPRPKYDKIVTSLSTDDGIDNVKYRNVRNNFLLAGMLVHKKAATLGIDPNTGMPLDPHRRPDDDGSDDFADNLVIFQGDTNACSIMDVTVNSDEDVPDFKTFEPQNYDTKFTVTENSTVERIYAAFGQEPFYCIRVGKLGFTGTVINDAFSFYNSYVEDERKEIARVFEKVFSAWSKFRNDGQPVCPSGDYSVLPLKHISNESTDDGDRNNNRVLVPVTIPVPQQ